MSDYVDFSDYLHEVKWLVNFVRKYHFSKYGPR